MRSRLSAGGLAETREFYVTCLRMRVVEEWREEEDVVCILALTGDGREALLEISAGGTPRVCAR